MTDTPENNEAAISPPPEVRKSFLVQKFARIQLGAIHVIGYSVSNT